MRSFAVVAAIAGLAAAAPQAVTSAIAPNEISPAGCKASVDGSFMLVTLDSSSKTKRSFQKRADASTALEVTLKEGVLTDAKGRTGYIASNNQFQFDGPVQAGAIYTAGFSLCANNSIALGDSTIFYQCLSGSFYNLYDESEGAQCSQIYLNRYVASSATAVSAASDGQPTAASAQADGQVTAAAAATVLCQIGDGQVQHNTCMSPVTQIADGQVQASSAAVVSQITDGQVQASSAAATTSAAVVSQITDGQVQASSAAATTAALVSQIGDGQVQAANATSVASATLTSATSAVAFTGAAATFKAELFGLVAGIAALAVL